MIYQFRKRKKAFTLVEVLISVSILIFVILAMGAIFKSSLRGEEKINIDSLVLSDINYFLKLVSTNVRQAEISDGSLCDIPQSKFFKFGPESVTFIKDGECYAFNTALDRGTKRLIMFIDSKRYAYISSKQTNIIELNFEIEDFIDYGQPLLTVSVQAEPSDEPGNIIQAQTSVSVDYYK